MPGEATLMRMLNMPVIVPITPIMQNARMYCIYELGWRKDMPWENFLDTVTYHTSSLWTRQ